MRTAYQRALALGRNKMVKAAAGTILGLVICCFSAAGGERVDWQLGRVMDEQTTSTYLGSLTNRTSSANVTATRIGNTVTAQGQASAQTASIPIYRVDQVVIIETANYAYLVSRRVWWSRASVTVNGPVWFAIRGTSAYVLDDTQRQFKTALLRKVFRPPVVVQPVFESPFMGEERGKDWRTWVSVSGPNRYSVRLDGTHVYAEQILSPTAWLKIEAIQSGNMYVGVVHFGFIDSHGKSCSFEKQAEFTHVDPLRIDGAMVVLPSGASINPAECIANSNVEIRRFSWVPE